MAYIEGFIAAVPARNKDAYRQHASTSVPYFKKLGVTRQVEAWGDDVPAGKVTDFGNAVKAKPDEVVIFSWLEYPDKPTRDKANEQMRADPAMAEMGKTMPFDGQRMIWGGFTPINDTGVTEKPGYIDGIVTAVPVANKDAYREMADKHAALMKEYGATRTVDAWGDDVPDGKVTDFKGAVKATDAEKVVYSWIEWPSKEARDKGWDAAMKDPRMKDMKLPFDGQRLIYGGFAPLVDQ
ncbi:MAG: DUF1428 domain-containing protein [Steroidobacteraceae bacterium]|nr:DUF1428 domain-containing protein [Steroidobacteraceae bacterium]